MKKYILKNIKKSLDIKSPSKLVADKLKGFQYWFKLGMMSSYCESIKAKFEPYEPNARDFTKSYIDSIEDFKDKLESGYFLY